VLRHGLLWAQPSTFSSIAPFCRKAIWALVGIYSSFWMNIAFAAPPPMAFNSWINNGGTIQIGCPTGFTCNDNVVAVDMLQRIITRDNSGETYIQNIVSDNTAQRGQHSFETFANASNASNLSIPLSPIGVIAPVIAVPDNVDIVASTQLASSNTGIAAETFISQSANTPASPNPMTYRVAINTGWAVTAGQPAVDIFQNIKHTTPEGIVMDYTFKFSQNQDAGGNVTGKLWSVDQLVTNAAVIGVGNLGTQDDQRTIISRASGDFITAGSAILPFSVGGGMVGMAGGAGVLPNPSNALDTPPANTIVPISQTTPFANPPGAPTGGMGMAGMGMMGMGMMAAGVLAGGTITWNTGDEIQMMWIGAVCPGCMNGMGGMGQGFGGMGSFSFQQYENITAGVAAATRSLQTSAPFTWTDPPFGPQPPAL